MPQRTLARRAIAGAFAFLLLPPGEAAEAQADRPRPISASRRDDALKARRPYCVQIEGVCPVVFGPPPPVTYDSTIGSAQRDPAQRAGSLFRTLLGETVDVYAGVAYTPRTRYGRRRDGTLLLGGALGDPARAVGIEVGLAFFSTLDTGFGERMGLDIRLNRLLPGSLLATAGWENVATRGYSDIGSSRYVALTRWFAVPSTNDWFSHVVVSAGAGDGRFTSERNWIDGTEGWNLVGSVGVQLARPVLLLLEWPGDDLTVGAAIAVSPLLPFVVTPALTDITGSAGDGMRFVVSATYVLRLRVPS